MRVLMALGAGNACLSDGLPVLGSLDALTERRLSKIAHLQIRFR
jgi:hypothetical protein